MKPDGKPILLARVGGLSPYKHRNGRAPEKKGFYAYIWPQIELFLLGSTDAEGIVYKDVSKKVPWLLRKLTNLTLVDLEYEFAVLGPPLELKIAEKILQESKLNYDLRESRFIPQQLIPYQDLIVGNGFLLVNKQSRRPSRLDQLQNGQERLRKFKYAGFLWSILDGGPRAIRRKGMWSLHHSEDLVFIARQHYHNLKKDRRAQDPDNIPAGASPKFSKDEWEVFVPANQGVIS